MSEHVVAIDGPSASGKSTVAKKVAAELEFLYVDSGAVYRAVTWLAIERGIVSDVEACKRLAREARLECFVRDGAVRFSIEGHELNRELRGESVTGHVSHISAIPEVRVRVVSWLRGMIRFGNLVMEGRDIGTAVFPDTPFKFYLDADPAERARRRSAELAGAGAAVDEAKVRDSLKMRDRIDSSREKDPLKIAPNAVVIDTTGMSIEQVAAEIVGKTNLM